MKKIIVTYYNLRTRITSDEPINAFSIKDAIIICERMHGYSICITKAEMQNANVECNKLNTLNTKEHETILTDEESES